MNPFVLDTSVALTWVFRDEATPATDALFDRAYADGVVVPSLFVFEIANTLTIAQRKSPPRTTPEAVSEFFSLLGDLRLHVDDDGLLLPTAQRLQEIAAVENLTGYDAAYLDVAKRHGLPLATLDRDLRRASTRRGVTVWPALP